jgi:hypothetical protein
MMRLVHPWVNIEPWVDHDPVDEVIDHGGYAIDAAAPVVEARRVLCIHRRFLLLSPATAVSRALWRVISWHAPLY